MKKALFLLIPAVFRIFGSLDAIKIPCTKTYKAENGRSCYPCSPGFHKLSDCDKDNETAICTKCDTGRYQPDCDNSPECLRCSPSCLVGQEKVKECSDTSNIECQCTSGLFWQPNKDNPDGGQCSKHSLCLAGEGVLEKGTPLKDTTCGQCQEGVTYSDKKSFDRCTTCSKCNNTIAQKCSLTNDTICGHKSSGSSTEKDSGVVDLIVISVLSFVIILVVIVAVVCYRKRKKNKRQYSTDVRDVELPRFDSSEQSNRRNDSKEPSKQNGTKVADEQDQEVSENAGHVVSENEIALDNRNGYLGSQQTQQNLVQNNNISDHRATKVSASGVVRKMSNTMNFENLVGNENYESSEKTDVISTDAIAVSPRPDSSDAQTGNDDTHQIGIEQQNKDETDITVEACPLDNSSVDTTVPEGSVHTDLTEKSMSVPQFDNTQTEEQTCLTDDEVWMEVFYFLGRHLVWNEFKSFFRWLVVKTNKTLSETKDAEIERVHSETGYACKESTYKLMELWKQSTSNASLHDVLSALSKLQLIQKCEKLTEMLQKKGVVFQTCNEHTESSTKHYLGEETSSQGEVTTKTMLPVNIQSDNQQMMELKGHISTL